MAEIKLAEKFIAYIDILGYSALTKAAEAGTDFSFSDLEALLKVLGSEDDRKHHQKYGPTTCPMAPRNREDLDFQVAQVWDSVVVSAEISPGGVVNIVSHCFGVCIRLLASGVMCRGYVTRGMIYHDGQRIFGSGHVDTVARERQVTFFKQDADERGTPFIEIDPEVVGYISAQPDKCVKEMFGRMTLTHEGVTAIFPIKLLSHPLVIGGIGRREFNPKEERQSNEGVREELKNLKAKLMNFVNKSDLSATKKANHYIRAIDRQLNICDRTDEMIDALCQPFPSHR